MRWGHRFTTKLSFTSSVFPQLQRPSPVRWRCPRHGIMVRDWAKLWNRGVPAPLCALIQVVFLVCPALLAGLQFQKGLDPILSNLPLLASSSTLAILNVPWWFWTSVEIFWCFCRASLVAYQSVFSFSKAPLDIGNSIQGIRYFFTSHPIDTLEDGQGTNVEL